jgi:serine/threonine protein phosphatase PrpC
VKPHFNSFSLAHSDTAGSDDALDARQYEEIIIAVVADGVGGARKAREAAQKVVKTVVENFKVRPTAWSLKKTLEEIIRHLNRLLYQESLAKYEAPEMLSTLAVAVVAGDQLCGMNVGDSRVYLLRAGQLEQMTCDHRVNGAEQRHVLSQALGMHETVTPHYFERQLQSDDLVFLCTDGVSDVLEDAVLEKLLRQQASARALISHAREQATPETLDDMSAIIVHVPTPDRGGAAQQRTLKIPDQLAAGQCIDGFELVRPLSANGRTWLASKGGTQQVLKFAPREARENETIATGFVREMWHASRIFGPAFVPAVIPEAGTMCYYAMDFVSGRTLKEHLESGPLKVDEAVALARFLLAAAQHLLRFDFVHADIKPENILVLEGADPPAFKLIDYGSISEIFSVTSRAGTPSYLAPERFGGSAVSERTEIFAIGVTLYQATTRSLPYGETEPFQTPKFHTPKNPSLLNPIIPAWFESIMLRSLSVDPELRHQNYSEMEFELANPDKVKPFFRKDAPLLERNPLLFYKVGFFLLLLLNLYLLLRLLAHK